MRMLTILMVTMILGLTGTLNAGWNPAKEENKQDKKIQAQKNAKQTVHEFKKKSPKLNIFFDKAYGYAVFPTVGKAGFGIGGAYGSGVVYKRGKVLGYSTLTQLTIGFQFGGQAYSEIIFFKDKDALDKFTEGNFELGAQASAVAITAGASADVDYSNGVAIFTMTKGGLMYEATVGGQKFSYKNK